MFPRGGAGNSTVGADVGNAGKNGQGTGAGAGGAGRQALLSSRLHSSQQHMRAMKPPQNAAGPNAAAAAAAGAHAEQPATQATNMRAVPWMLPDPREKSERLLQLKRQPGSDGNEDGLEGSESDEEGGSDIIMPDGTWHLPIYMANDVMREVVAARGEDWGQAPCVPLLLFVEVDGVAVPGAVRVGHVGWTSSSSARGSSPVFVKACRSWAGKLVAGWSLREALVAPADPANAAAAAAVKAEDEQGDDEERARKLSNRKPESLMVLHLVTPAPPVRHGAVHTEVRAPAGAAAASMVRPAAGRSKAAAPDHDRPAVQQRAGELQVAAGGGSDQEKARPLGHRGNALRPAEEQPASSHDDLGEAAAGDEGGSRVPQRAADQGRAVSDAAATARSPPSCRKRQLQELQGEGTPAEDGMRTRKRGAAAELGSLAVPAAGEGQAVKKPHPPSASVPAHSSGDVHVLNVQSLPACSCVCLCFCAMLCGASSLYVQ